MKKKGTGSSGGSLTARIKDWEQINGANATSNIKMVGKMAFRRPGSQNPRKSGPLKRASRTS